MLTDDARREYELPSEIDRARERDAQMTFPALEEPTWLEDDEIEEMEAPRESQFRGIWIGVAAAAVTFVLVFAIPHWLGWYDVGPNRAKRDTTPESVISTVTAKPSGGAVDTPPEAPAPSAPPSTPPAVSLPKAAPPTAAAPPAPPAPARSEAKAAPAPPAKRTYSVQIAAFKDAGAAKKLADRVKGDGYPAAVRRVESGAVPWVVRVGTYSTREQAESARDALARKGHRGFIL
jgi:cell division septation protein DedD